MRFVGLVNRVFTLFRATEIADSLSAVCFSAGGRRHSPGLGGPACGDPDWKHRNRAGPVLQDWGAENGGGIVLRKPPRSQACGEWKGCPTWRRIVSARSSAGCDRKNRSRSSRQTVSCSGRATKTKNSRCAAGRLAKPAPRCLREGFEANVGGAAYLSVGRSASGTARRHSVNSGSACSRV